MAGYLTASTKNQYLFMKIIPDYWQQYARPYHYCGLNMFHYRVSSKNGANTEIASAHRLCRHKDPYGLRLQQCDSFILA